jgi:hypothetical protein
MPIFLNQFQARSRRRKIEAIFKAPMRGAFPTQAQARCLKHRLQFDNRMLLPSFAIGYSPHKRGVS